MFRRPQHIFSQTKSLRCNRLGILQQRLTCCHPSRRWWKTLRIKRIVSPLWADPHNTNPLTIYLQGMDAFRQYHMTVTVQENPSLLGWTTSHLPPWDRWTKDENTLDIDILMISKCCNDNFPSFHMCYLLCWALVLGGWFDQVLYLQCVRADDANWSALLESRKALDNWYNPGSAYNAGRGQMRQRATNVKARILADFDCLNQEAVQIRLMKNVEMEGKESRKLARPLLIYHQSIHNGEVYSNR